MDLKVLTGFLLCVILCPGQAEEKANESSASPDSQVKAGDDSDMYMEPLEGDHQISSSDFQPHEQWFPSFQSSFEPYSDGHPPSGHSRPIFYNTNLQQEGAYSQRNDPPAQQDVGFAGPKFNGFNSFAKQYQPQAAQQTTQRVANDKSASLLGDGNFGVIQGGTFYPEKNSYDSDGPGFDDFSSFFHNGHGRPSYFYKTNPKPGKQQQFENFRDFADINSPPERQYSQYVVVYTNKNGTRTSSTPDQPQEDVEQQPQVDVKKPRNILESLAMLDQTQAPPSLVIMPTYNQGDIIDIPPEKKRSMSKRKLAKLLPEKKHEAELLQKAKDMVEPLLALS